MSTIVSVEGGGDGGGGGFGEGGGGEGGGGEGDGDEGGGGEGDGGGGDGGRGAQTRSVLGPQSDTIISDAEQSVHDLHSPPVMVVPSELQTSAPAAAHARMHC